MLATDQTTQTVWPDFLGLAIVAVLFLFTAWVVLANILEAKWEWKNFLRTILKAGAALALFRVACLWYYALYAKSPWDLVPLVTSIIISYPESILLRGIPYWGFGSKFVDAALLSVLLTITSFAMVAFGSTLVAGMRRWGRW